MYQKRLTAFLLAVILLFGAAAPACAAGARENAAPPAAVLTAERLGGALGSVLGRLLKLVTFTDESRIQKAKPRDAAGQAGGAPLFTGAAERTLTAETWRMVELTYESEKTYADPSTT